MTSQDVEFTWEDVEDRVRQFTVKEKFLLCQDVNERSITHKLAEFIVDLFPGYDIDCEYNKMYQVDEDGHFMAKRLNLDVEDTDSTDEKWTTVFPDIIVHDRTGNQKNLLIIEVKKKKYADATRKSGETYRDFDKRKITEYTVQLGYKFGLYIEFNETKTEMVRFVRESGNGSMSIPV